MRLFNLKSIFAFLPAILIVVITSCSSNMSPTSTPTVAPSSTSTPEVLKTPAITPTERNSLDFQKGITFVSWQKGEYFTPVAEQSLTELASTGANWVAILVTVYQKTASDTQITATKLTPSDEDLTHIISKAHDLGLKVLLKPHIDIESGQWRGEIAFSAEEDWNAWFDSYRQMIDHYADLAQQTQTEAYSVGTELVSTSGRSTDWERVVEDVRSRFTGKLTYASNFDEVGNVQWWNALDYIGVDAYFPLPTPSDNPTVEELEAAWADQGYLITLKQLSDEYNRPVLLTEIGYRSVKGANEAPWEWHDHPEIDLALQSNLYEAALETFSKEDWVAGMFFWNWLTNPDQGGENDPDYTPKGKPAEDVLKRFYNH
jgi:hypothetical protein